MGGAGTDTLDLSRLQNLETVRSAQSTLAGAQADQETLQGVSSQVQELQSLATQATNTDLTSGLAQQLENELRNSVLQQATGALQSQGGFNREVLVGLLGV
ncbi:MAG: hypothetical protein O2954_00635 [bacterium]|nr:hypothetical protein [bacterium]